ncbi:hypothetical protein EIP91_007684 [Steccherinum ochraceum]|uniref:Uncharacterized protein n=1 Tax=Steccherinum ochraceum TaxID=92696 RepID=A0A4R0RI01_9APHY|nr:hypothetical protein EIP91_007684 [Steccherinum ochraceum]
MLVRGNATDPSNPEIEDMPASGDSSPSDSPESSYAELLFPQPTLFGSGTLGSLTPTDALLYNPADDPICPENTVQVDSPSPPSHVDANEPNGGPSEEHASSPSLSVAGTWFVRSAQGVGSFCLQKMTSNFTLGRMALLLLMAIMWVNMYFISAMLFTTGIINKCPSYGGGGMSCMTVDGAAQHLALQHFWSLPAIQHMADVRAKSIEHPTVLEDAYVDIAFSIPALHANLSSEPHDLLDKLSSYQQAMHLHWDSIVTMQYIVKDILGASPSSWRALLRATADLRQLAIANTSSRKPLKSVSIIHNLDHLVPVDPNVVKVAEFVLQSGLLSLALPYRVARFVSLWKYRPLSDEEMAARWLQLRTDQETWSIVHVSLSAQTELWTRVHSRLESPLSKLAGTGLQRIGHELLLSLLEEIERAHALKFRIESEIGRNCTSIFQPKRDSELYAQCKSAAADLRRVQTYVDVLEASNKVIVRETSGFNALFSVSESIEVLIHSLGFLHMLDTSRHQFSDIKFHDVLDSISLVAENIRSTYRRTILSPPSNVTASEWSLQGQHIRRKKQILAAAH